jgi:hypothetical protein
MHFWDAQAALACKLTVLPSHPLSFNQHSAACDCDVWTLPPVIVDFVEDEMATQPWN